jgi:hypothetical protein
MQYYGHEWEERFVIIVERPRKDLCMMNSSSQSLQTGDRVKASLANGIYVQTTLVSCDDDVTWPKRKIGTFGKLIEAKEITTFASFHP